MNHLTETVEIVPPITASPAGNAPDRGFLQLDRSAVIDAVYRLNLPPALSGTLILLAMNVRWDGPALTIPGASAAEIGHMINTTPKAARRLLAGLETAGAIEWQRASNEYTGAIVLLVNLERPKRERRQRQKTDSGTRTRSRFSAEIGNLDDGWNDPIPPAGEVVPVASKPAEVVPAPVPAEVVPVGEPVADQRLSWTAWNRLPDLARQAIPHCHPDAPEAGEVTTEPVTIEPVTIEPGEVIPAPSAGLEAGEVTTEPVTADPVGVPLGVPESGTPDEPHTYLHVITKKNPPNPPRESDDGSPSGEGMQGRIQIEESTRDLMDAVADQICDRREADGWKRAGERARRTVRDQAVRAGLDRLAFEWQTLGAAQHRIVQAITERFRASHGEQGNPLATPFDLGTLADKRRRNAEACHRCDDGWIYNETDRSSRICECQNLHNVKAIG